MTSAASLINAQFVQQTDGKYLVKTKGGAVLEFWPQTSKAPWNNW
jgi:hypothetical protein